MVAESGGFADYFILLLSYCLEEKDCDRKNLNMEDFYGMVA